MLDQLVDAAVEQVMSAVERRDGAAVVLPPAIRAAIVERVAANCGVRISDDRSDSYVASYWKSIREHIK